MLESDRSIFKWEHLKKKQLRKQPSVLLLLHATEEWQSIARSLELMQSLHVDQLQLPCGKMEEHFTNVLTPMHHKGQLFPHPS